MDEVMDFFHYILRIQEKIGGEAAWKILLLKSMIFYYRLLNAWRLHIFLPVAIIVNDDRMQDVIMDEVRTCLPATISATDMSESAVDELLKRHNSDCIMVKHVKSRNTKNCLQRLAEISEAGRMIGKNGEEILFSDIVLVFFKDGIPLEYNEFFSGKVVFKENVLNLGDKGVHFSNDTFWQKAISGIVQDWPLLRYQIEEMQRNSSFQIQEAPEMWVFRGTEIFLLDLMEKSSMLPDEREYIQAEIKKARDQIEEEWFIDAQTGEWETVACKYIFKYAKQIPDILNIEALADKDVDKIGKLPMYDQKNYYLPTSLFDEVFASIYAVVGIRQIKEILANKGILKAEGNVRRYYTVHVPILTSGGQVFNPRMIVLVREKIDIPGHLTWLDAVRMKGGDDL